VPFSLLQCTGLFISPSGISELDCATTKTDTAERSISISIEFWRDSLPIDMLLSAFSVLVVAQLSLEIPEGLMNYPVFSMGTAHLLTVKPLQGKANSVASKENTGSSMMPV
jgi:hypothetical protein